MNGSKSNGLKRFRRAFKTQPKVILFLLIVFFKSNCFAQKEAITDIQDISKVTFLNPGLSFEKRVGKLQSICVQAFGAFTASVGSATSTGNTTHINFDPAFTIQYRYYYNLYKRTAKGKFTERNSLNYLTASYRNVFSRLKFLDNYYNEIDRRPINTLAIAWGMQRNYKQRFSLDLNFGVGYFFTKGIPYGETVAKNISRFMEFGQLSFGFWLNKRK